eukprot:CCRYP_013029-RA/>CCRYP_013029-RA protein AED:0.47 eAED:0.64 QI:0/0/0/1/0/0/3/0/98
MIDMCVFSFLNKKYLLSGHMITLLSMDDNPWLQGKLGDSLVDVPSHVAAFIVIILKEELRGTPFHSLLNWILMQCGMLEWVAERMGPNNLPLQRIGIY